jgi:hypothetical protein
MATRKGIGAAAWLAVSWLAIATPGAYAQAVPAADRDAILKLASDRGVRVEDAEALLRPLDEAGARGLPVSPLANKVREGLVKGADPKRIDTVVRQLAGHLGTADALIRELSLAAADVRDEPVMLLADALSGGVTTDEVRELRRQAQSPGTTTLPSDSLASAAKGLSLIKGASLPAADGTAVMAEAVRHGYRSHEMLEVGRQVKRRERDYRDGHATLRALRDAIARGERPDQIFATRAPAAERPAATRPDPTVERPTRPARPETPVRPQRPERPQAPVRPEAGPTRE